jgi:hypothetical protein
MVVVLPREEEFNKVSDAIENPASFRSFGLHFLSVAAAAILIER